MALAINMSYVCKVHLYRSTLLSNCKQRSNNDAEEDGEDEEEELMLRQAIALSLKGVKEEGDQEKSS